jgi:hypothetical protein
VTVIGAYTSQPYSGYVVPREAVVSVEFSQPMGAAAVQRAFSLTAGGSSIAGDFKWNNRDDQLTFIPKQILGYGTQYTVLVDHTIARSAGGSPLEEDAQTIFTTIGLPDIVCSQPPTECDQSSNGFGVRFTGPMKLDVADMQSRITFQPISVVTEPPSINFDGTDYATGEGNDPGTDYTITIDVNGLVDEYGTPFHVNPNSKVYSSNPTQD